MRGNIDGIEAQIVLTAARFETLYQELVGREPSDTYGTRCLNQFQRYGSILWPMPYLMADLLARTLVEQIRNLYELRGDSGVGVSLSHDERHRGVGAIFERIHEARVQLEVGDTDIIFVRVSLMSNYPARNRN